MELSIQRVGTPSGERWQVRVGATHLIFNDQASASTFVQRLKARLEAPHPLPQAAGERHVAEQPA